MMRIYTVFRRSNLTFSMSPKGKLSFPDREDSIKGTSGGLPIARDKKVRGRDETISCM